MKATTYKKLDKKLQKLKEVLEKLIDQVEDMQVIVNDACEQDFK